MPFLMVLVAVLALAVSPRSSMAQIFESHCVECRIVEAEEDDPTEYIAIWGDDCGGDGGGLGQEEATPSPLVPSFAALVTGAPRAERVLTWTCTKCMVGACDPGSWDWTDDPDLCENTTCNGGGTGNEDLQQVDLLNAIQDGDPFVIASMLNTHNSMRLNWTRSAIQVLNCSGTVRAHYDISRALVGTVERHLAEVD